MLAHDKHVADIAHSAGSCAGVGDVKPLQSFVTLLQVLHQLPQQLISQDLTCIVLLETILAQLT